MRALWICLGLVDLATFVGYGFDKRAARRGWRRIPEATLHLLALAGGTPAAFLAQRLLRHKTRKPRFQIAFWLIAALQLAALLGWFLLSQ